VHDPWLVRRLPALVRAAGVHVQCLRSYGYFEVSKPGFMLPSWVDLGADADSSTRSTELGYPCDATLRRVPSMPKASYFPASA